MTHIKNFEPGDRVLWQYEHAIGRNRFYRVKKGTVIRRKHKKWGTGPGQKKEWFKEFMVLLDGNKTPTVIHENDLRHERITKEIYRRS